MSKEQPSIHEFDFEMICEYFSGLERQGPGSRETTVKAAGFLDPLTDLSRIADIGCGTGGQTMTLAQHIRGTITGIDLFPRFIDLFNQQSAGLGLQHRAKGVVATMENLPFATEELDLIWSEGAIYNIGFERGIREWRKFLKPGGFLAVTEASWFTEERPEEIETFWREAYPGIDTIARKVAQLQQAGYIPVATFILPETCWTDHFYAPQVSLQKTFLTKYAGNANAEAFIANERREAELYQRYREFYGYVFYIGKKR